MKKTPVKKAKKEAVAVTDFKDQKVVPKPTPQKKESIKEVVDSPAEETKLPEQEKASPPPPIKTAPDSPKRRETTTKVKSPTGKKGKKGGGKSPSALKGKKGASALKLKK